MSEYDDYIKNRDRIKKIMSFKKDFRRFYGERGSNELQKAYDIIVKQMDKLMTTDNVRARPDDAQKIKSSLGILLSVMVNDPITKFTRDLTREFAILAFNWNKHIGKCKPLEVQAQAVLRIVKDERLLRDSEDVLRKLIKKAKTQLQVTPAAFELSRHYLRGLEE